VNRTTSRRGVSPGPERGGKKGARHGPEKLDHRIPLLKSTAVRERGEGPRNKAYTGTEQAVQKKLLMVKEAQRAISGECTMNGT